jgi:conjugative relaxase-like TrwC/TraI family protein
VLSVAKLARGREDYYLATVASGREEAGVLAEPEGRWLGQAAAALGLAGTVDGPGLRVLLTGVDPVTGEVLSAHHDRVRVAAYDCTYSTPKSVSVLHALGPEDVRTQVRAGHEEAAAAALGYLERCGARVRRRLARGEAASSIPAGGFVAAAFLHRISRAPDPHLHSHVLVANLAPGPDGRWSALDARGLFLELGTARDLYETQLRSELTGRLGVSWRELQGAWADLAGIDPGVRRAFSRRSAEIETALAQAGQSGPRAARIASVRTRPDKDLGTPYDDLVVGWRERSYRLGVSDARLGAVVRRSRATGPEPVARGESDARLEDRWAERALGEQGVAARDGTCRRGDLIRARCASLPSGAPVTEVERDVGALLAEGRVIPVPTTSRPFGRVLKNTSGRGIPGGVVEPVYTTPAVLEIHESLTRLVRDHPETVELLAYRPGRRLPALDAIGGLSSSPCAPVVAVAPGRQAAASFESVTGIETAAVADVPPGCARTGVVVVAEAQRMGPWELSSVVGSSLAGGGRVILFAPSAGLDARFGTAAVLAPDLALFAPGASSDVPSVPGRGLVAPESHCFAGREVLVVADGPAAREALLTTWQRGRASGQRPLVVASDDAVVASLRASVRDAGGSPDEVVEARRLASRLAGWRTGSDPCGQLVVLGSLPNGVTDLAPGECVHVAIVSPQCSVAERLGRAAEVARPRYLVSALGATRSSGSDRSAWRDGATAIEAFRRRWSIDDQEHAVGDRTTLRSLGLAAAGDVAETRLKLRNAVRTIERPVPAVGRRTPEAPGRAR